MPIGFDDDTAYLGGWRKRVVDAVMAVPGAIKEISSITVWRYVTVLSLLRRRNLSLISVWHPSFLALLIDTMRDNWDRLVTDLADGTCAVIDRLPPLVAAAVQANRDIERAEELRRADINKIDQLWPNLRLVSCWADGNSVAAASQLARIASPIQVQPKGLLATEGVISIPFEESHPLAIRSHFLEFEDSAGHTLLASDLSPGIAYGVIMTTAGGLYRYRLHDQVEVAGKLGQTPSIRFVGKSGLISDRMGEKLSDGFVAKVFASLFTNRSTQPTFAMLAPDIDAEGCRYTLYLNTDVTTVVAPDTLDSLLASNPQYAYCRRLAQLKEPRVFLISGDAYAGYCDRLQKAGQRLGDIKPACLSCLDNWSDYFAGHYVESCRGQSRD